MENTGQVESLYHGVREDYEKETHAPYTDSLSGLFNHGFFREVLHREIKRSARNGTSFCVAMIDIDGFVHYNEQHGPVHGDYALRMVGAVIGDSIRESDLAARHLGDVFILLLSDACPGDAELVAHRIQEKIDERFSGELTVSIGCVPFRRGEESEGLVSRAKEALASAKMKGRGGICLPDGETRAVDEERFRVAVVDDEPTNVKLMEAMLKPFNCEVIKAANGREALEVLDRTGVDLILLDAMMPYMDGFETCRRLKGNKSTRMIPVIMITALDDTESKVRAIEAGADEFISKPPNRVELMARIRSLIRTKRLNDNLVGVENVLFSLASAVEAKDAYTEGHVRRVSKLAVDLGHLMALPPPDIEALRIGGILHDIGKIGVPDSILNKPGRLDPDEWEIMKSHPDVGYRVAQPLKPILKGALDVIRHHHEKLDGSGYPDGAKGEEISVVARIMAVADIFDALVTARPYREGVTKKKALEILEQEAREGRVDAGTVSHLVALVSRTDKEPELHEQAGAQAP